MADWVGSGSWKHDSANAGLEAVVGAGSGADAEWDTDFLCLSETDEIPNIANAIGME